MGTPLEGIEAVVFDSSGEAVGSSSTNSEGKFTVSGLGVGSYKVRFQDGHQPEQYVSQFYNAQPSFAKATPVSIAAEGEAKTSINAELREGGVISGMVTDAATHQPLANVFVEAVDPGSPEGSLGSFGNAITDVNGKYAIFTLASATGYEVEFVVPPAGPLAPMPYLVAKANGLSVAEGRVTALDQALTPTTPHNTAPPIVSGTPSLGQQLSCSRGSWTGLEPFEFAYQWLRDGSAIVGASGPVYVVQAVDQGHDLGCEVTAKNDVGNAAARSANTIKVAAAQPTASVLSGTLSSVAASPLRTPPAISAVRMTHKRFRVANAATAVFATRAPLGTSFHFVLSGAAKVQISIRRSVPGRRRGRRCVTPTATLRRTHASRCVRTVTIGTLTRSDEPPGVDDIPFSGRIGRRPLGPAIYSAALAASNASGRSALVVLRFAVVR